MLYQLSYVGEITAEQVLRCLSGRRGNLLCALRTSCGQVLVRNRGASYCTRWGSSGHSGGGRGALVPSLERRGAEGAGMRAATTDPPSRAGAIAQSPLAALVGSVAPSPTGPARGPAPQSSTGRVMGPSPCVSRTTRPGGMAVHHSIGEERHHHPSNVAPVTAATAATCHSTSCSPFHSVARGARSTPASAARVSRASPSNQRGALPQPGVLARVWLLRIERRFPDRTAYCGLKSRCAMTVGPRN